MAIVVDKRLPVEAGQKITIWGLFDAHIDNSLCHRTRLERDLAEIAANPDARVVIGGDWNDMMFAKGDPRAYSAGINKFLEKLRKEDEGKAYQRESALADATVDFNLEYLAPIADKIDAYLDGNHEQGYCDRHGTNVPAQTVNRLNEILKQRGSEHRIPYVGYMCYLRHYLDYNPGGKWKSPSVKVIDGMLHHGKGGGAPVTKGMIDITRIMTDYAFHWGMSGHIHKKTANSSPILLPAGEFGKGRYVDRPREWIICPGYERVLSEQATHHYSERGLHCPNPIGAGRMYFDVIGKTGEGPEVEVRWN